MQTKPEGYNSQFPYLVVADPEAVLAFCEAAFGAERLRVFRDGNRIEHAECRIDDTVLMVGGSPNGTSAMLQLFLPDPDAAHARALGLGAEELQPTSEKGDGDRRGGFRTPCGTSLSVARQV